MRTCVLVGVLKAAPKLTELNLIGTPLTKDQFAAAQAELPKVKILR